MTVWKDSELVNLHKPIHFALDFLIPLISYKTEGKPLRGDSVTSKNSTLWWIIFKSPEICSGDCFLNKLGFTACEKKLFSVSFS